MQKAPLNMLPNAAKYLGIYGEKFVLTSAFEKPAIHSVSFQSTSSNPTYSHCIIIPAYNESTAFIRRLMMQSFCTEGRHPVRKVLIIIVVNQPFQKYAFITRLNKRLLDFIWNSEYHCNGNADQDFLAQSKDRQSDFLIINQCCPGINPKQGVGYARKLGCDIAVELMQRGIIDVNWLYCTDADASLPKNYFDVSAINKNSSALIYSFKHSFTDGALGRYQRHLAWASKLYETSILYYRDGLAFARSPYAYTSLGSALALHPDYYCQARGFPKRSGGEDFYVLNKLVKLAPIQAVQPTILLKPRASRRVPFGTGPAVATLLKLSQTEQEAAPGDNTHFVDFNPCVFNYLKEWLDFMPILCGAIADKTQPTFDTLSDICRAALDEIHIQMLIVHLQKQATNPEQALRMAHGWFDGFKTLKFIHAVTRTYLPKIAFNELKTIALKQNTYREPVQ
jgi:hypothetical protein